jgi:uncharacterized protein
MTTPAIAYEPAGGKGRFVARDGDALAGELVVSRVNDGLLIIEHTEVAPSHAGTGLGKRLVAEAVAWARAEGQQFLPLCPFARAIFDRTPEYGDVRQG